MLRLFPWLALGVLILAAPNPVRSEQLRFHFVPADACGAMRQVPAGPEGAIGELKRGVGLRSLPYTQPVRPNQMVTFRHPYNGRNVTVPIRLPEGTPRMEHQYDRIIYNYNDYTVEARFRPDGSVDVVYNSGLLRPLRFD